MTRPQYVTPAERKVLDQQKFDAAVRSYVVKMRESGITLQQIADDRGCSRQAVHQMLKRYYAAVDRREGKA